MTFFTFTYNGTECNGNYCRSLKSKGWFKVIFFEHSAVISATPLLSNKNARIWVQIIQQGESVWPHDLIQSMGESIEMITNNQISQAKTNNKYQ